MLDTSNACEAQRCVKLYRGMDHVTNVRVHDGKAHEVPPAVAHEVPLAVAHELPPAVARLQSPKAY